MTKENTAQEMTDSELIEKCRAWITDLCQTGGRAWSLRVPVDEARDPDILLTTLINRFASSLSEQKWSGEWISVEDKDSLPPRDEAVLIANGNTVYALPHYFHGNNKWFQYGGGSSHSNVTHWMPLPTPPQK